MTIREFYVAMDFEIPWSSDDLAYVRARTSFLLQAFNEPAFTQNYQMRLLVENIDDWHIHLLSTGVVTRSAEGGHTRGQAVGNARLTLFDPGGVLWRIAQNTLA